jgi:hypothetical protein
MMSAVKTLGGLTQDGELCRDMAGLGMSFLHMHINRMMQAVPNIDEAAVYDFLRRVYRRDNALEKEDKAE